MQMKQSMLGSYAEINVYDLVEQLSPTPQFSIVGLVLDKNAIFIQVRWADTRGFSQRETKHDARLAAREKFTRRNVLQDDLFVKLDRLRPCEFAEALARFEDQPIALHKGFDRLCFLNFQHLEATGWYRAQFYRRSEERRVGKECRA